MLTSVTAVAYAHNYVNADTRQRLRNTVLIFFSPPPFWFGMSTMPQFNHKLELTPLRSAAQLSVRSLMANGIGIETPANKIATAQATLELAIRLNDEVLAGRITPAIFTREVTVHTGGPGLRLPALSQGTSHDLQHGIFNIVLIALGASALTVDETLDEVFGKAAGDSDPSRKGIRVMVNQLRNAFAHNPWRPRWLVFEKYRRVYPITLDDGSAFTFDSTQLNGRQVKPEDVGGLEFWVRLLQHCERLVE